MGVCALTITQKASDEIGKDQDTMAQSNLRSCQKAGKYMCSLFLITLCRLATCCHAEALTVPNSQKHALNHDTRHLTPQQQWATVTISHVNGVAATQDTWHLSKFLAFAGEERLPTAADSYDTRWFPQSHVFTIKVRADVTMIAFALGDAEKVLVNVEGATNNRRAPSNVVDVVHWSNPNYRDGGEWTAEDNFLEPHWAYNAVTISQTAPTLEFRRWSELPGDMPGVCTVTITHVSPIGPEDDFTWHLSNFLAFAGDEPLRTAADSSTEFQYFLQGDTFTIRVRADVTMIAFAVGDVERAIVTVEGATDNRVAPASAIGVVHWSNPNYRDGGEWTAEDNEIESHWAYNAVTISNTPSSEFLRWSELPGYDPGMCTVSVTHISKMGETDDTWHLSKFLAFSGDKLLPNAADSFDHQWFPQGHVFTIKVPADVTMIAFAMGGVAKVLVRVVGATDNRMAPLSVIDVVHWSNSNHRDGGEWTAEDNDIASHWAYTAVTISHNPSSEFRSWSELFPAGLPSGEPMSSPTSQPMPTEVVLGPFEVVISMDSDFEVAEVKATLEKYLFESLSKDFDGLQSVILTIFNPDIRNRSLQAKTTGQIDFTGKAVFLDGVPSADEITSSQTDALDDTQALQRVIDENPKIEGVVINNVAVTGAAQVPATSAASFSSWRSLVFAIIGATVMGVW